MRVCSGTAISSITEMTYTSSLLLPDADLSHRVARHQSHLPILLIHNFDCRDIALVTIESDIHASIFGLLSGSQSTGTHSVPDSY